MEGSNLDSLLTAASLRRYQGGGEVNNASQALLERLAAEHETGIRKFIQERPTITKTYEDLLKDIKSGALTAVEVPTEDWESEIEKANIKIPKGGEVGGFYSPTGESGVIKYPTGGEDSLPHEILHHFASHYAGDRGTPSKINPYKQLDMALRGWLPSFHPAGRRPTIPGDSRLADMWNKKYATPMAWYSNNPKGETGAQEGFIGKLGSLLGTTINNPYDPWFDEPAFDSLVPHPNYPKSPPKGGENKETEEIKPPESQQTSDAPVSFDKNNYPIYNKQSNKAQSFRDAFRQARREGEATFTWDGRLYTSELKK